MAVGLPRITPPKFNIEFAPSKSMLGRKFPSFWEARTIFPRWPRATCRCKVGPKSPATSRNRYNSTYFRVVTRRIMPVSNCLITMVSKFPKQDCSPSRWPKWLINGVTTHVLAGMILQVSPQWNRFIFGHPKGFMCHSIWITIGSGPRCVPFLKPREHLKVNPAPKESSSSNHHFCRWL